MSGKFIVFEGIDGSGKSTLVLNLAKLLWKEKKNDHILITREPTSGFYGQEMRRLLKEKTDPAILGEKMLELNFKDKVNHVNASIKPALEKSYYVLCDRYMYSSFVYQGLQGITDERLKETYKGLLRPDVWFLLDLSPEKSLARLSSEKDLFEKIDWLTNLRNKYLQLAEQYNGVILNAELPADKLAEECYQALNERGLV
ncbi:putative thymidylate kinase [uncultured archaeon]|nr:putative thymidylate kinase [uncultured archaeon]